LTYAGGETCSDFLAPTPRRLVGDGNTSLSQQQLNITQAEAERVLQPHGVADYLGR
jgi:hypothetical protein